MNPKPGKLAKLFYIIKTFSLGIFSLLPLVALLILSGCDNERPTLDIESTVPNKSSVVTQSDPDAVLRVAIGAMISPEITRVYYQDLLELIAAKTGRRAVFSQRRTYAEINELVKAHEVDVALVCSGPYASGHAEFGMELLAAPVAHGQQVYHSYFIVPSNSPAKALADLRGKRFAFTDPHSNTGYLVPNYVLARQNETPATFFSETFFTNSHDNSIRAVAEGLTDGAAVDSLIWEFMNNVDPIITRKTKIITKSPPFGIPPVVVHPDLDPDLKRQLKAAFLSIDGDLKATPLLRQIQIERFAEAEDGMYDSVREMQQWLEKLRKGNSP